MKRIISVQLFLILSLATYAQRSKVTVVTPSCDVTLNGVLVGSTIKLNEDNINGFVVVSKKGFVTFGDKNEELIKKGETSTITLTALTKPSGELKSRKIEFAKFLDAADLSRKSVSYSYYGGAYVASGFDVEDPIFTKPISKLMTEWGYAMIGSSSVFGVKEEAPELVLAGEIIGFGKDTRGSGFQASTLVNWSLLDIETKKVVYTGITGGFSDSKKEHRLSEEFSLALRDATIGLMNDPKFQAVALRTESTTSATEGVATSLPIITPPAFSSYGDMIKNVIGSAVTIKNGASFGSGFVISKSGYLLTNNHVVAGATQVEIIFNNGFTMEGTVIKNNSSRDVALVKISGSGFKPLAINSDIEALEIGTEVIAIGTPEDISLNQTVTKGIISGKRELEDEYSRKNKFIQTDVTINKGNSGGPLLNTKGEVVGIIVAKIEGKSTEGLGFAVPIGEALEKLNVNFK